MNNHRYSVGASSRWWDQKCEKHVSRVIDYLWRGTVSSGGGTHGSRRIIVVEDDQSTAL